MYKEKYKKTDNEKVIEQAAEQWVNLLITQLQSRNKTTSKFLDVSQIRKGGNTYGKSIK